jgi:DNA-binding response OmpR family regulator
MYKILIIEDDEVIREQLKDLLERYGYEVVVAQDFDDVAGWAVVRRPDLVILDLNLPVYDGYHVCRQIRQFSSVPIVVVTSRDSEMDELMSLNLGADDFITKPYNSQILIAKIAALLKRTYQNSGVSEVGYNDLRLDLAKGRAIYGDRQVELTKNESGVLRLLIENEGRIVTREDIMEALWQADVFVDDNTLTVNVNRLRKKLVEIGAEQLLRTRRGQGYSL